MSSLTRWTRLFWGIRPIHQQKIKKRQNDQVLFSQEVFIGYVPDRLCGGDCRRNRCRRNDSSGEWVCCVMTMADAAAPDDAHLLGHRLV